MIRIDPPQVFVHEYVSGEDWAEPELSAGLAAKGRATLYAVLAALNAWGKVRAWATIATAPWQCYQLFRENTISTPETRLVRGGGALNKASRLNPPRGVKPRDGAGPDEPVSFGKDGGYG
jgi:hypothetical protein